MPVSTDKRPQSCDDVDFARRAFAEPTLRAAQYFIDNQTCPLAPRARPSVPDLPQRLQLVAGAI